MNSCCDDNVFGADPAIIRWSVVRGDTSRLRVEFLENDEVTKYDTSEWTYVCTVYDKKANVSDTLSVTPGDSYVDIIASSETTLQWGTGTVSPTTELSFDLQVTFGSGDIWTPVIGTITTLADVTPSGGLL
jgi:hypothetical protein